MTWFGNLGRTSKFFLIGLPLAFLLAVGILSISAKKALTDSSCGCGPPPAEASGEYHKTDKMAIFNGQPVGFTFAELTPDLSLLEESVLGAVAGERWIEIDLSEQKLRAWESNNLVYEFLVSSGKWAPTPTGDFRVWIKLRYTKMEGGRKGTGTYYYLPNVPYTQYFYKGYGVHGTYWHQNFGHPMSHGCVNLATPDAEKLFYWTTPTVPQGRGVVYPSKDNPGTRVVVHE